MQGAIATSRYDARNAGLLRLNAEARGIGVELAGPRQLAEELARDTARARLFGTNFGKHWLEKATGSGLGKTTKAIDVANKATMPRITTIGVTESSDAFNTGRAKYLRVASDTRLLKVWDATLDKRTCPVCAGADGTIVFANEQFPQGTPGSVHARCRCIAVIIGQSERANRATPPPAPSSRKTSIPAAAAPKAKPIVGPQALPGGKLNVTPETKALARRLDVALGSVAQDGGRAARAELRSLIEAHGYKSHDALRGAADVLRVGDSGDMAGFAGFHNWDGSIVVSPDTIKHSRAALRKIQLGVDPGAEDVRRLASLIHEEIHGASAMASSAYQGAGAAIEEAATELAARRITAKLTGHRIAGIYDEEIDGLRAVVGRYSKAKPEAIAAKIDSAVDALKSRARWADTPEAHVREFVDALKLGKRQAESVLRDLTQTEWWKPGAQPAVVVKPKATRAKKTTVAKDPRKTRAPPKTTKARAKTKRKPTSTPATAAPGYFVENVGNETRARAYERMLNSRVVPESLRKKRRGASFKRIVDGLDESDLSFLRTGYRAQITPYTGATAQQVDAIATGAMPPIGARRPLPPIKISFDGKQITLVDGRHRLEAAQLAGATKIRARIIQYDREYNVIWEGDRIINLPKPDPTNVNRR